MDAAETIWQELVTSALLGTERRAPALASKNAGALADVLGQLDASDPAHFLLQAAAVCSLYQGAGRKPSPVPGQAAVPCEADGLPRCGAEASARATPMLRAVRSIQSEQFLPEWLAQAAAAGKRVSEELLPILLEWGENNPSLMDLVLPVLGERGRWLARQAPWAEKTRAAVFVEAIPLEQAADTWQTETRVVRENLLGRVRRANPDQGRALVESTWKEDSAEERAAFLAALKPGLGTADEPFLETALDDRAKTVRAAAAEVLAGLGKSRLVQRQAARAQACLQWKPGSLLRKAKIEVVLPETCEKDMLRDGIEPKRAVKDRGQKADWLVQILSAVPPGLWSWQWGKTPAELLEIAEAGDWQEVLLEGWSAAALRHADPEWAEALLRQNPRRADLLQALPTSRRQPFLLAYIQAHPGEGLELLFQHHAPWGPELTRLCLKHLRGYYARSTDAAWQFPALANIRASGRWMDPTLLTETASSLKNKADPGSTWENSVEILLQTLEIRLRMMEELK